MDVIRARKAGAFPIHIQDEKHAHLNYGQFYAGVKAATSREKSMSQTDDFNKYVLTTVEFNVRYRELDGTISLRPTNTRPQPLAANSTAAQQTVHKALKEDHRTDATIITDMINRMVESTSIESQNDMNTILEQHPNRFDMPWNVSDFLFERYGTLRRTDILVIKEQLAVPYDPTTQEYKSFFSNMNKNFSKLQSANQALAQIDQMEYGKISIQHQPDATAAYYKYIQNIPLEQQTFINMAEYIVEQAPLQQQTTGDTGYSAANSVITIPPLPQSQILLKAEYQRDVQANSASRNNSNNNNNGSRNSNSGRNDGRDGGRGRGRGHVVLPPHYCYKHGHNFTHKGAVCKNMLGDPTYWTSVYLKSTSPTAVEGGSTKVQRAYN